jgi:PKD repeat protein
MGDLLRWLLVLTIGALLAPPAYAQAGSDCECALTGEYVLPLATVDIEPADAEPATSPDGTYEVFAAPQGDGSALLTISDSLSGDPILSNVPGVSWGFSPDEDRFVTYFLVGGLPYARIYNLLGTPAGDPIYETDDLSHGGRVVFSPTGRYALAMRIQSTGINHFAFEVIDAEDGTLRYQDEVIFSVPSVPDPNTKLGGVRVGFGPNAEDRSLVYAWISGNGFPQRNWVLVNLAESPATHYFLPWNYDFEWAFSPCGDRYGVVSDTGTGWNEVRLYSTLDFAQLGTVFEWPLANDHLLEATASEHLLHYVTTLPGDDGEQTLAPNTAGASCGGPEPAPPVAEFTVGAQRLAGVPVAFTDASTTPAGMITARQWWFGDGGTATGENPTHGYASAGTYSVRLQVSNSGGRADTVEHELTVAANQLPVPSFTYAPLTPNARDIVTFTDTSTDDDGIMAVNWSINGESLSGSVVDAKVCGPVTNVQLIVTDHAGQSADVSLELNVGGTDRVPVPAGGDLDVAAEGACPGDTLVLEAGTYPGGVTLDDVHIEGAGQGVSIIDGADADGWVLKLRPQDYSDVPRLKVSGVTVTGGMQVPSPYTYQGPSGGGIQLEYHGSAELQDVEIAHNQGMAGLYLYNTSDETLIENSSFHHNECPGLVINVASATVSGSTFSFNEAGARVSEGGGNFSDTDFHDNLGSGLLVSSANATVWGSRFYGNGSLAGAPAVRAGYGHTELAGSLVVANYGNGIEGDQGSMIFDSTIADNCGTGVVTDGSYLYNSIVHGNALDIEGTWTDDASNLIATDPLFVGGGDFHLSADSPAIDAGDTAELPIWLTEDADGDERVLASGSGAALLDIGWDEWTPNAPLTAVPLLSCNGDPSGTGGSNGDPGGTGGTGASGEGGAATGDDGAAGEAGSNGIGTEGSGASGGTGGSSGPSDDPGEPNAGGPGMAGMPGTSNPGSDADDGCGCRIAGGRQAPAAPIAPPFALASILALLAARRRLRT